MKFALFATIAAAASLTDGQRTKVTLEFFDIYVPHYGIDLCPLETCTRKPNQSCGFTMIDGRTLGPVYCIPNADCN